MSTSRRWAPQGSAPAIPVIRGDLLAHRPTLVLLPEHLNNRQLTQDRVPALQGGLAVRGGRLSFDGADDYIDLGNRGVAADAAHTVVGVATLRSFNVQYPVLFNYLTTGGSGRRKLFFSKYIETGYADITFGLHGDSGTGTAGWSLTPGQGSGESGVLNVEHSIVVRCAGVTTTNYEMWRAGQKLVRAGLTQATNTQTGLNTIGRSSTNEATNHFDGYVSLLVVFDSILPDSLCLELSANPWSMFTQPRRTRNVSAGASSTITGTASYAGYTTSGGLSTPATVTGTALYAGYTTSGGLSTSATITGTASYTAFGTSGGLSTPATITGTASYAAYTASGSIGAAASLSGTASYAGYTTSGGLSVPATISGAASYAAFGTSGSLSGGAAGTLSGTASYAAYTTSGGLSVPAQLTGTASYAAYTTAGGLSVPATLSGTASYAAYTAAGSLSGGAAGTLSGTASYAAYTASGGLSTPATISGTASYAALSASGSLSGGAVSRISGSAAYLGYSTTGNLAGSDLLTRTSKGFGTAAKTRSFTATARANNRTTTKGA